MCGIAGWIDWQVNLKKHQSALDAMVATLACRGPDGSGTLVNARVALGHRRLVVIDPVGGIQPMSRRFGNAVHTIVYNGEIYNFQELRAELESRGHTFTSRSDTEVLLKSYIEWGSACVDHLNGIFAFAIWNDRDHTLFAARDRLGVKPLFYARRPNALFFGSELKALLAHPLIEPVIGSDGLAEIFALGPARTPGHGIYQGIEELPPGHWLQYRRDGLAIHRYWQLGSHEHPDNLERTAQTVRDLLQDAVTRQLVADVPVVTLLSGGLDSSAVSAVAAQAMGRQGTGPLHTFSVDFVDMPKHFQDNGFQTGLDAPWAEKVSWFLRTEHHAVLLDTPDLVRSLLPALRARDIPGHADVDSSLLVFAEAIAERATVGLSGEAADEIFGGYPWFHRPDALQADTFPWALRLRDRLQVLNPEFIRHIKAEQYVGDRYQEALRQVPRLPGEPADLARIREIGYLSITRFLPTLLDRKDRMTMAASLEVRVPFCDHRLVEYVWNIPWSMKNTGNLAKGILRRALADWLPEDVVNRRKSPYPSTPNPTYFQAMSEWLLDILEDPAAPVRPFVDLARIRALAQAGPQARQLPWFGQLMGNAQLFAFLIQANAWLREYRVEIR
ncbi:MAG: asparagine synthase (glutamine-hydrolyzing) [Thermaerobacter sp.]|nr:asparagine synthase (glutamine-hydrolyzing) [Thermaerobacter sp.]